MDDHTLVLNAGSSSLKFCSYRRPPFDAWGLEARGQVEAIGTAPRLSAHDGAGAALIEQRLDATVCDGRSALDALASWIRSHYGGARVLAVGHRVVHGGARYARPTLVTPQVMNDLRELIPLAPLHQPHSLAAIEAVTGFTALDGLCMGTRPGSLDPGVVLYLFQDLGLSDKEVEAVLYKESGLLGISGITSDMRVLLESSEPGARLAVDYFVYRAAKEIGALAAVLGGIDALVFCAGIGENSAEVRRRICESSRWLGVELDAEANARGGPRITRAGSRTSAWVIPTNEELMIARHTSALLELGEVHA